MEDPYRLLRLSYVPRWTIIPTMRTQSVAEHSFRVAVITGMLYKALYGDDGRLDYPSRVGLVESALSHDIDEAETGDIPTPAKGLKKECPGFPHNIVKMADLIEAYTFILAWGVGPLANAAAERLADRIPNDPCVRAIVSGIIATGV